MLLLPFKHDGLMIAICDAEEKEAVGGTVDRSCWTDDQVPIYSPFYTTSTSSS